MSSKPRPWWDLSTPAEDAPRILGDGDDLDTVLVTTRRGRDGEPTEQMWVDPAAVDDWDESQWH